MRTKNNIIDSIQMNFVQDDAIFPSTRYQGSKFKIAEWVWNAICNINFKTALDAFGGT